MANRQRRMDEAKIARWYKEGRGDGHGAEYHPWFKIQDVSSEGRSHRVLGRKTGRIHHLLSDIEFRLFLHLDWCDDVVDIREQFPLSRDITRRITQKLGIIHPADKVTRTQIVMTTDFLVNIRRNGKENLEACFVKPASKLENGRVLEKLEIERCFWAEQGIPLHVFTEREFASDLTKNLEWLRTLGVDKQVEATPGIYEDQLNVVLEAIPGARDLSVRSFCQYMDQKLSLEPGSSLTLVRHLLTIKAVSIDLTIPWNDNRSMSEFTVATAVAEHKVA